MGIRIRAAAVIFAASAVALSGTALAQAESRPTSYLGGTVFYDLNGDGVRQDGEPGVRNADVMVAGPDGVSYPYPTDNYGNWLVKRAPSGEYVVSYVDPVLAGTTPSTVAVTVEDDSEHTVDFGLRFP
jgi:serine-aspartate repeat-containing protein C/D/E